jgi:hypothetical protein
LALRCASLNVSACFSPIQSDFYLDPSSDQHREIDVAVWEPETFGTNEPAVVLPVECKRSGGAPWVLLARERGLHPTIGVIQRAASRRGKALLEHLSSDVEIQRLALFSLQDPLGYSLVAAKLDGKEYEVGGDRAYRALLSLTTAAAALVEQKETQAPGVCLVAVPTLVVDGELFIASLATDGAPQIAPIECGTLAWRNPRLAFHSFVTVTTEAGLPSFVEQLQRDLPEFLKHARANLPSIR